ncbi:MAG: TlpA family protein disulfide reductase [Polyangiaceae bacterium]|nr:TlpA family protein disulfide reductase [Polyangiaceae bacterium]
MSATRAAALVIALSCAVAGCDKSSEGAVAPAPTSRSEVVAAKGPRPAATPSATHATAPKAPKQLCTSAPAAAGAPLPRMKVDHLEATGGASVGDRIPTGGRWTWVNLWAAWCGPCKEEIPVLRSFEQRLAAQGAPVHLAFVSLDDDERQAVKLLDSQPPGGLRASFWLKDGKMREGWLAELKLKTDMQLPQQLLFDPSGALRCVIDGAIDAGDYEQLRAVFSRR